jgi:hypothetical protein
MLRSTSESCTSKGWKNHPYESLNTENGNLCCACCSSVLHFYVWLFYFETYRDDDDDDDYDMRIIPIRMEPWMTLHYFWLHFSIHFERLKFHDFKRRNIDSYYKILNMYHATQHVSSALFCFVKFNSCSIKALKLLTYLDDFALDHDYPEKNHGTKERNFWCKVVTLFII